jgi:hypothetical protein
MPRLSLKNVMNLLEVEIVSGTPEQQERLCKWISGLVEKRGNDFVRKNRRNLLGQWERHLKVKSEICC